jgi:uncharacterized membrane protein
MPCVPCINLQAYGKTTYLITNLKLVPRGTEGAVSLEGTLAGLAAAAAYATVALAIGQVRFGHCMYVVCFQAVHGYLSACCLSGVFANLRPNLRA